MLILRGGLVACVIAVGTFPLFAQSAPPVQAKAADALVDMMGVNTHLSYAETPYYAAFDTIIKPRLKELGVRHVRDGLRPVDAKVRGVAWIDRVRELSAQGLDFTFIISPNGNQSLAAMADNAAAVVPYTKIFEGPNELDMAKKPIYEGGLFPAGAVAFEGAMYKALKADARTARVPVAVESFAHTEHVEAFCAATTCPVDFADLGNMHSYSGARPPSVNLEKTMHDIRLVTGDRPLVTTETGYHTDKIANGFPGVSETAAGKYMARLPFEYLNRNIGLCEIYELIDQFPDAAETDKEKHFGLLRFDGSEKPSYVVLKRLITLLEDPGPVFTPRTVAFTSDAPADVHQAVLAKRDGRAYIALWHDTYTYDVKTNVDTPTPPVPVTLNLTDTFRSAKVYRPLDGDGPVSTMKKPRSLKVDVPDSVVILELIP